MTRKQLAPLRVLLAYGTTEGQTGRIVEHLARVIRDHGYEAFPVDVSPSNAPTPDAYDAVIVGASVHMGKHQRYVMDYVRENRDALQRLPSAFFSVSLAAHDDTAQAREEVEGCIRKFVQQTGWEPGKIGVFPGALLYTRYGFFKRWIMRKIAHDKGSPDLDTSRDYEYTDWEGVKRFAEEFLKTLVPKDSPELSSVGQ